MKIKLSLLVLFFAQLVYATSINDFIDKSKCSQIIDKGIYSVCYSYEYKGALGGWTKLNGALAVKEGIRERPRFYDEPLLPKEHRTTYSDYTGYGKDWNRGHFIAADADFDYDELSLQTTYSMANIIPQSSLVNQKTWTKVERYGRLVASKLGELHSISIAKYNDPNLKMGKIMIPTDLYRIYFNDFKNFKKCFHYKNELNVDIINDDLRDHEIDCKEIEL